MAYYTIKQLSEEFNVSRQAIHKQISKKEYEPFKSKQRIDNYMSLVVNEAGYQRLLKHFNKVDNKVNNTTSSNNHSKNNCSVNSVDNGCQLVDELKQEINYLRTQNKTLLETLQHEQELHLMDQKQVKELENKVKQLENQPVDNNVNNINNSIEDTKKEPPKKWWQFWK